MIYYAVETGNPEIPMLYFDTLEEAQNIGTIIYICDENHACVLFENKS